MNEYAIDIQMRLDAARTVQDINAAQRALDGYVKTGQIGERLSRSFQRQIDRQGRSLEQSTIKTEAARRAQDRAAQATRDAARNQDALNTSMSRGLGAVGSYDQRLTSLRYALFDIGQTAAATSALLIGGTTVTLSTFAEYEASLATVSRTTGATGDALAALSEDLLALGESVPVGAQDLAEIATAAGQLGIAEDQIISFTETIAKFATISDSLDAADAAPALARIAQLTGTNDFEAVAGTIATLSDSLNATDAQIVSVAREVSRVGAIMRLSTDEVLGLSAAFASVGIAPEQARSVLNQFTRNIDEAISGVNDNLGDFARLMGITEAQVASLWQQDSAQFLVDFTNALAQVDPTQLGNALNELGIDGARAAPAFALLTDQVRSFGEENAVLNSALETSKGAFEDVGVLSRLLAPFLETLKSQFQFLLNDLQELAIVVGEAVAPTFADLIGIVRDVLQGITEFARSDIGQEVLPWVAGLVVLAAAISSVVAPLALMGGGIAAVRSGLQLLVPYLRPAATGLTLTQIAATRAAVAMGLSGVQARFAAGGMIALQRGARLASAALKAGGLTTAIAFVIDPIGTLYFLIDSLNAINFALLRGLLAVAEGFGSFITGVTSTIPGLQGWTANALTALNTLRDFISLLPVLQQQFATNAKIQVNDLFGVSAGRGRPVQDTADSVAQVLTDMEDIANIVPEIPSGFDDMGDAAGGAADNVDDLAEKVRTLVDYANDLSGVFARTFDLQFANQSSRDSIDTAFYDMRDRFDQAAQSIRDLRDEIRGLNADITGLSADLNTQRYFLSIAVEYGDDLRATEIRAKIADLEADLAEKRGDLTQTSKELKDAENANSRSLLGNSRAAIENRAALTGLVQQYQDHLTALAASGASTEELRAAAIRLKAEFYAQARAMGYSQSELVPYVNAFDRFVTVINGVPRDITIDFNADPALQALAEFQAALDEANRSLETLNGGGPGGGGSGVGGGGGFEFPEFVDPNMKRRGSQEQYEQAARDRAQAIVDAALEVVNQAALENALEQLWTARNNETARRRGQEEAEAYAEAFDEWVRRDIENRQNTPANQNNPAQNGGPLVGGNGSGDWRDEGDDAGTQWMGAFENRINVPGFFITSLASALPTFKQAGKRAPEEFKRPFTTGLDLRSSFDLQQSRINESLKQTGRTSQGQFRTGFTNGLSLNATISQVGAKAAPAMSDGGRSAGTYFRGGFSSNADISGIISREGNAGAPGMKQPGVLAGAYYRDGFNTNSSVADIVAKSARNANTQEYVNLGRSAGENFKQGFRSNGTLDVALDLPNGMKAAQGGIGKLRFYSGGGYTGQGGKYEAAGIVHKGEYVIPKKDVNQSTGMPYADALGRLQRGSKASGSYANGGYVSGGVGNGPIELGDRTVMKVARAVQHITVVGDERVANAAGRGNAAMQRRGGN